MIKTHRHPDLPGDGAFFCIYLDIMVFDIY